MRITEDAQPHCSQHNEQSDHRQEGDQELALNACGNVRDEPNDPFTQPSQSTGSAAEQSELQTGADNPPS